MYSENNLINNNKIIQILDYVEKNIYVTIEINKLRRKKNLMKYIFIT